MNNISLLIFEADLHIFSFFLFLIELFYHCLALEFETYCDHINTHTHKDSYQKATAHSTLILIYANMASLDLCLQINFTNLVLLNFLRAPGKINTHVHTYTHRCIYLQRGQHIE